jgi:hypothetical protein
VQWLFVCLAELVDEDPEEARARGAAVARRGVVVVAGPVRASRTSRARSEARNTAGWSGMSLARDGARKTIRISVPPWARW